MSELLADLARARTAGAPVGVTSVCSAHPLVLEAAIAQAAEDGTSVLIEATSNQVDQYGGYTGLNPADMRDMVYRMADAHRLPRERITLGGDHLGPNTWRAEGGEAAMTEAETLVEAYVEAGYTKIHLDCSMVCAGDEQPLGDALVAHRAGGLAAAAERAAQRHDGQPPVYVIGTEVPVPGGAHESIEELVATSAASARATVQAHREAFERAGLHEAWGRVRALVVQPGVEFDHARVVDYDRSHTLELRQVLDDSPHLVFEAHSTDYQRPEGLARLVQDGWAVLKVGPGLTFALREALFALAAIEDQLVGAERASHLVETVEARMLAQPRWWRGYYEGEEREQAVARRYSYSDRLRYYWPDPEVSAAQERLMTNLGEVAIPLPMISAHLPQQYARVRSGLLSPGPAALAMDRVREVLRAYARACQPTHQL